MARPSQRAIAEQDRYLALRQQQFRAAADVVTEAFASLSEVERVALIGSVARPLEKEVPRFRAFARAGIAVWHECKDLDLAVWLDRLDRLDTLRKVRSRALQQLFADRNIGVADHQVEVFILEPGSDRYRGRLCLYSACPKGKPDCQVPGCGAQPFLRQHEDFRFDPGTLAPERCVTLFDRAAGIRRRATDLPAEEVAACPHECGLADNRAPPVARRRRGANDPHPVAAPSVIALAGADLAAEDVVGEGGVGQHHRQQERRRRPAGSPGSRAAAAASQMVIAGGTTCGQRLMPRPRKDSRNRAIVSRNGSRSRPLLDRAPEAVGDQRGHHRHRRQVQRCWAS